MRRFLLASFLLLSAAPLLAQSPSADWRTIETPHFRFHYPAPFEEWTLGAATRMESIRSTLIEEIGYAAPERVDVIVADPMATANGSAWPFIGWPRMILWTNPPGPGSAIGANRDWVEMLTLHEQAHLIHILRPSRNPMRRFVETLLPLGPIAYAPRWISEGYATLLEGELTGSGRPNSDFRAAVIRQWARQGRMPSYAQLNSDRTSFMGMSMAYLVGSSYLEWLRARAGEQSLPHLWRRMTARSGRSFDDAFTGVFGDSPRALYARYVAEVTRKALEVEEKVGAPVEGELWQDFSWATEPPDVSPDGKLLVTVIRGREQPPRLVVFSTEPDVEAEKKFQEKVEKTLARDPEDVAPVRTKPLAREPKYSLTATRETDPDLPRWLPDGKRVLFGRNEMDGEGGLHPDLFIWTLESGDVRRVTHLADVREADPALDGGAAVAVRNRHGKSQLVVVDLENGEVHDLTPASSQTVYAGPRWGGDGIIFLRQFRGVWELVTMNFDTRDVRAAWYTGPGLIAQPAVDRESGRIFASVAREGFIEIGEIDPFSLGLIPLTRSAGASMAPAPTTEGNVVYYLSLDADGFDVRRLAVDRGRDAFPPAIDPKLAPVVPPKASREPASFEAIRGQDSRPYGIGRQEFSWVLGGNAAPSTLNAELMLRVGDIVGRLDTVLIGAAGGDRGEEGFALASVWRGWPVDIGVHLFDASQDLGAQPTELAIPLPLEERRGAEVRAGWDYLQRGWNVNVGGGLLQQTLEYDRDAADQTLGFVDLRHAGNLTRGRLRFEEEVRLRGLAGETEGDGWSSATVAMTGGVRIGGNALDVTYETGSADGISNPADEFVLGGVSTSIVPESARFTRVLSPVFPIGTATGDAFERQRAELSGLLPATIFVERNRLWDEGQPRGAWIDAAGLEVRVAIGPQPLLRVPGLELRAGAAQILDAPLEDEIVWWITTAWRP